MVSRPELAAPRNEWKPTPTHFLLEHPSLPIAFSGVSLRFLDRLLPNVNVVPSRFWFSLGLPCLQVDPMAARKKGDLVLYSSDLFPTEARKP